MTVDVPPGDARTGTARFKAAARKEALGLRDRGAFRNVKRRHLPVRANVIKGRFVYTINEVNTPEETPKARYVAQGQLDKAKPYVVHNLATLRQRSTRVILSTSANFGFRIYLNDTTQAYLQSRDKFTREIYLDPRPAERELFDLADDEVLLLNLPLYGVCDAGDYWHDTITAHIRDDLGMVPLVSDPALFIKQNAQSRLLGMTGAYVDDLLNGGGGDFQRVTEQTLKRFQAKQRKWDNAGFVGVRVSTVSQPTWHLAAGEQEYVDNLARLATDAPFMSSVSIRASLVWLAHTRPDIACGINQLAQVSEAAYGRIAIKAYNNLVERAKANPDRILQYKPLTIRSLRLHAYADASFAKNADHSSQVGYIILLCDTTGTSHVLSYSIRKTRRVVRSAMAGEVFAFTAALDEAFTLRFGLEQLYGCHIPLTLFTDSKQLFDVVTRASHPTEKRLLIDVAAVREAYNRQDLSNVALVASKHNMADGLTKPKPCDALERFLTTGIGTTPVEQWIIRAPADSLPRPTTGPGGV